MIIDATSLWSWILQGTAVVAIVAVALRLRPASSASTRALVWAVTLLAVPGVGIVLGAGIDLDVHAYVPTRLDGPASALGRTFGPAFVSVGAALDEADPATSAWLWRVAPAVTTVLVWSWVTLAMLRLGSLAVGLVTLVRWRARCRPLDPTAWHRLPAWTSLRDSGRRAGIVVSLDVRSPCVLGLWRPCIALPPSALAMRADALDAVLVHEYAHVQRRDDIAQFVQHLIAAVCALHPGVWWANRMLTMEREAACDDWVVLLATPTHTYASCLVALATGGRLDTAALQVGVNGGRSQLAGRVRRLVDARRTRRLRPSWATRTAVPVAVVLLASGLTVAAGPRHAAPPPPEAIARAEARRSMDVSLPNSRAAGRPDDGPARTAPPRPRVPSGIDRGAQRPPRGETMSAAGGGPAARESNHTDRTPPTEATRDVVLPAVTPLAVSAVAAALSPVRPTFEAPTTAPSGPVPTRQPGPFTEAGLAVADAGVSIGRGAARGGVATGTFFTRLGKRVARTF